MNATMTVAGYVWTSLILAVLAGLCLGYARRRYQDWRRTQRIADQTMLELQRTEYRLYHTPDFPRPMGATPLSDDREQAKAKNGWIAGSRFTLYADSDAEAIAKLTGEIEQ